MVRAYACPPAVLTGDRAAAREHWPTLVAGTTLAAVTDAAREWAGDLVAGVRGVLEPHVDRERARAMAAYMKDRFPFLGIATPARRALVAGVVRAAPRPNAHQLAAAARALWALDAREYQYVACDVLARHQRVCESGFLVDHAEALIGTKSWWDTVDGLRSAVVGPLVGRHPELVAVVWRWIDSDDVWFVRSAIIHQLGFGALTDEARLFALCARRADHPDFFVRKAIGWALREHAKRAPDAVRAFVADQGDRLSPLSVREALLRIGAG
jgi:3-methyladenine DNA glycosylase AlkD